MRPLCSSAALREVGTRRSFAPRAHSSARPASTARREQLVLEVAGLEPAPGAPAAATWRASADDCGRAELLARQAREVALPRSSGSTISIDVLDARVVGPHSQIARIGDRATIAAHGLERLRGADVERARQARLVAAAFAAFGSTREDFAVADFRNGGGR